MTRQREHSQWHQQKTRRVNTTKGDMRQQQQQENTRQHKTQNNTTPHYATYRQRHKTKQWRQQKSRRVNTTKGNMRQHKKTQHKRTRDNISHKITHHQTQKQRHKNQTTRQQAKSTLAKHSKIPRHFPIFQDRRVLLVYYWRLCLLIISSALKEKMYLFVITIMCCG